MRLARRTRDRVTRLGRGRALSVALVAFALVAALAATGTLIIRRAQHLTKLEPIPSGSTVSVRAFSHVYLIVFENKSEGDVLGSPDAPYLGELISRFGVATDYQAIAHPSQP